MLHVYTDGSVLVSHGGMEMGQGLHTKMLQVCSCVLQIPIEKIHIAETSSSIVPNATTTSGSFSTDLYGMAVKVLLIPVPFDWKIMICPCHFCMN